MKEELLKDFIKNLEIAGGEVLEKIDNDWYLVEAHFGVAENGAVWINDYSKELFLSEKVAAKMPKIIYPTMHEAIKHINSPGVFISGPSKTADVESFLVFGAHGPMRFGIIFDEV